MYRNHETHPCIENTDFLQYSNVCRDYSDVREGEIDAEAKRDTESNTLYVSPKAIMRGSGVESG